MKYLTIFVANAPLTDDNPLYVISDPPELGFFSDYWNKI